MTNLTYHLKSNVSFVFTISGIPVGKTASKFHFVIKANRSDTDASAKFATSTVPVATVATVTLIPTDLSTVDPGDYWYSTKTILNDGSAVATDAEGIIRIMPAGVEATS